MKSRYTHLLSLLLLSASLISQRFNDYYGAGHDRGIKVTASHIEKQFSPENTIDGSGLDASKVNAARFLAQAGFGGNEKEINALAQNSNYEEWIDDQFRLYPSYLLEKLWATNKRDSLLFEEYKENPEDEFFGPYALHFQYAWWDNVFKAPDQLRHRVAYALSQIMVISSQSEIGDYGEAMASYYDVLLKNAFGNYYDLLLDVSLDPNMGIYLSHLNNYKSNEDRGTVPDENFAREIMQLFSIGLYELNIDGTRKTDASGQWIPTYDNNDIRELAKVFTGLKGGDWSYQVLKDPELSQLSEIEVEFGTDYGAISRELPMQMDETQHEPGQKTIIGDHIIPAGQSGMDDIRQAVRHIFAHPNVGPFVAKALIQRLITSNPTPQYVERAARVFNDNGSGVRGDMQAVIKAILLDTEARSCELKAPSTTHGKLKEPILRYTQLMRGLPTKSPTGYYWNNAQDFFRATGQAVLAAPSVFNFYKPDFQPSGEIGDRDLVGPEFQIHNSQSAIGYFNQGVKIAEWNVLFWDYYEETEDPSIDFATLSKLASDPETLLNQLDIHLMNGRLSDETRQIIKTAMLGVTEDWGSQYLVYRTSLAIYLAWISPDFVVLK